MAEPGEQKKVTFYRLDDLEVTAVALVDQPAVGIPFLVLKRLPPASEEDDGMTTKRSKAAGDPEEGAAPDADGQTDGGGGATPEAPALAPEVLRTLKNISTVLAGVLPEEAPEGCEICATARAFQAAAEKASGTEEASKDDSPVDFRSAWEGMVMTDQLWKCFMTLEAVVTNIARSDKVPEEKAGLFDTALTDFGTVARELLGLAKSADPEPPADETEKREDAPAADAQDASAGEQELLKAITDLAAEVLELGARVNKVEAGGETPKAPAVDGAAGPADETEGAKPLTRAEAASMIQKAIAEARKPIYKSKLPEPAPDGDGETPEATAQIDIFDSEQRRKRLRDINVGLLKAGGAAVEE